MKVTTPEQEKGHQQATIRGAATGLLGGLAVALPGSYILNRRWTYYRSLPLYLKALGVITVVIPSFAISAERAGLAYERTQWHDVGADELHAVQTREQARWDAMTAGEKIANVASRHQYSIIGASWATSIVGGYAWAARDPYQTTLQKIAQTRVWAQGVTLGVIIGAAVLAHSRKIRRVEPDHSWAHMIHLEEEQKKKPT